MASGTSKKTELKLVGVARASLEELLLDFKDFLRQKGLCLWGKDHPKSGEVRGLCYRKDRSYKTYNPYIESSSPEVAANTIICLIHQTNYLLDQQLRGLEKGFLEEGGFTEKLYRARVQMRAARAGSHELQRRRLSSHFRPPALCFLRAAMCIDPHRAGVDGEPADSRGQASP